MRKYRKAIVAALGAAGMFAAAAGWVSPEGAETITGAVVSVLTVLGVWGVPNEGPGL